MFCKNCGEKYLTEEAVICVKCGVAKGKGSNYCHNCGNPTGNNSAAVCLNCGVALNTRSSNTKSKMVAGLLGIFVGCFGVHNFYLGYTTKAIIQLVLTVSGIILACIGIGIFMVLGAFIWSLLEGIFILTGQINVDGEGKPLSD